MTVVNGTGSGVYEIDTAVTVTAPDVEGKVFTGWTAEGVTLTDKEKQDATVVFFMPENDVTLTANYGLDVVERTLRPGWNLIATPGNLPSAYNATWFEKLQAFAYDQNHRACIHPSLPLAAGEPLWVFSGTGQTVRVVYEDVGSVVGGLSDKNGWQLVGVSGKESVEVDGVQAAWRWGAGRWQALELNDEKVSLPVGQGCFIYRKK